MARAQFAVSATCTNPRCPSSEFQVLRRVIDKTGTDERPYRIHQVVCPSCRCWGDVTQIKEVAA